MNSYDLEDGIQLIRSDSLYEYDPIYFYGPVIIGLILASILLILAFITIKKKSFISVLLTITIFVIGISSVLTSWYLTDKNTKIVYTDCTIKLTRGMTRSQLEIDYNVIKHNDDGTYVIRLYW